MPPGDVPGGQHAGGRSPSSVAAAVDGVGSPCGDGEGEWGVVEPRTPNNGQGPCTTLPIAHIIIHTKCIYIITFVNAVSH